MSQNSIHAHGFMGQWPALQGIGVNLSLFPYVEMDLDLDLDLDSH